MNATSKACATPWLVADPSDLGSDGADTLQGCEPLGFEAGDENLYRYVGNSPTNATDPDGLQINPVQSIPSLPGRDNTVHNQIQMDKLTNTAGKQELQGVIGPPLVIGAIYAPGLVIRLLSSPGGRLGAGVATGGAGAGAANNGNRLPVTTRPPSFRGGQGGAPVAPPAVPANPGKPFPCNAQPGQTLTNIDPNTLQAGRGDLVAGRLATQQRLIQQGTPRTTPIQVTPDGVIWDGNHGARAAAEAGVPVTVEVIQLPPGMPPPVGRGPVTSQPIRPGN